jgi:hypothetical protein
MNFFSQPTLWVPSDYAGFSFSLLFEREDGGDTVLRNNELSPNNMVSYRALHSYRHENLRS